MRYPFGGSTLISVYVIDFKDGERGRNRTYNLLIKSQLLCQLSYAPVSGLSFSPGDPPIFSRVAGDRFMLQPGSCCRNHWISGLQTTSTNITQGVAAAPTPAIEDDQSWFTRFRGLRAFRGFRVSK